jgi:hypothetical protein
MNHGSARVIRTLALLLVLTALAGCLGQGKYYPDKLIHRYTYQLRNDGSTNDRHEVATKPGWDWITLKVEVFAPASFKGGKVTVKCPGCPKPVHTYDDGVMKDNAEKGGVSTLVYFDRIQTNDYHIYVRLGDRDIDTHGISS